MCNNAPGVLCHSAMPQTCTCKRMTFTSLGCEMTSQPTCLHSFYALTCIYAHDLHDRNYSISSHKGCFSVVACVLVRVCTNTHTQSYSCKWLDVSLRALLPLHTEPCVTVWHFHFHPPYTLWMNHTNNNCLVHLNMIVFISPRIKRT